MVRAPIVLVIFGITGNLAQIKLIPALYDLFAAGQIPPGSRIIGLGRAPLDSLRFGEYLTTVLSQPNRHHSHSINPSVRTALLDSCTYLSADVSDPHSFDELSQVISETPGNRRRIFYLATYPSLFASIFAQLHRSGLTASRGGWVRVVVEKPLGDNLASAKRLNRLLGKYFIEDQIYRLDHYLGKETLQNILSFRFGNNLFEPLINRDYLDHIQITAAEDFGIGLRGSYYDPVGALRDVGQNHLLQMLALSTMATPSSFTNEGITSQRISLIKSMVPDPDRIVFAQYRGYRQESHVLPGSTTETFFALRTHINHPRFQNVPIYLRAGKKLASTVTEVALVFKNRSNSLFSHLEHGIDPNVLIYRIQPNEGIIIKFLSKQPGPAFHLRESALEYCYRDTVDRLPDAYERLLTDVLRGDQTFFNDAPEVEAQWRFTDPLLSAKPRLPLHFYPPGSWGPAAANALINSDHRAWITPSPLYCRLQNGPRISPSSPTQPG